VLSGIGFQLTSWHVWRDIYVEEDVSLSRDGRRIWCVAGVTVVLLTGRVLKRNIADPPILLFLKKLNKRRWN